MPTANAPTQHPGAYCVAVAAKTRYHEKRVGRRYTDRRRSPEVTIVLLPYPVPSLGQIVERPVYILQTYTEAMLLVPTISKVSSAVYFSPIFRRQNVGDFRFVSAQSAFRIGPNPDLAEGHIQRFVNQQLAGKTFADAQ